MPVATLGTVKAVNQEQLEKNINASIILGNAYHLYLKPGLDVLTEVGGIHSFMTWKRAILTDSGGYQVYSLAANRKISEKGVCFKSHIDGSTHLFTPEKVIDIQRQIGSDIMMAFDECTPYPCSYNYARDSLERTHRWAKRCHERYTRTDSLYGYDQLLFPVVQGSVYPDLRIQSTEYISNLDLPGLAIGGLAVGEPAEEMYAMVKLVCDNLPINKPRYLMGVGTPANLLESIALGIDMFDCVMPTRNARNGMLFTTEGIINIRNEKWKKDFNPLDNDLNHSVSRDYSRAYLRHLFLSGEMLGAQLASIHNLAFYSFLMQTARKKIQKKEYDNWKRQMVSKCMQRL